MLNRDRPVALFTRGATQRSNNASSHFLSVAGRLLQKLGLATITKQP